MRPTFKQKLPAAESTAPRWRYAIAWIFFFLQFYKITKSATGSFYRFCALDLLFILVLARLRIPWLNFRKSILIGFFTILVVFNAILFDQYILKYTVFFLLNLTGRKIAITGSRVRPESPKSLARQHLSGKYTVNFLPESLATLQADDPVCIDNGDAAYFHLILNNTTPQSVTLAAQDFNGERFNIDFDQKQLRGVLTKSIGSITHMYLPVTHTGYYKLGEVIDKSLASVKLQSPLLIAPPCPSAKVVSPSQNTVCQGSEYTPILELTGIPPFEVTLSNSSSFIAGVANDYKLETVSVPAQMDTSRAGKSELKIIAIKDALNNLVKTNQEAEVEVHSPATIERIGSDDIPLLDGAVATYTIKSTDFPVKVAYSSPDGEQHVSVVNSNKFTFPLDQEGTYIVEKLSASICPVGKIKGTRQVRVFEPPPTTINATFEQLKDKCSGPSGINADLNFGGTPPFKVWYRTLSGSRVVREDVQEFKSKADFITFKPGSIGTFKYQVTAFQDKYRKVQLAGAEFEETQIIRELAGASFLSGTKTSYCPDQVAHITAKVQGKGPLRLVYELDKKQYTEENVDGDLTISLGKLSSGQHRVVLKSITDIEGCTTPLDVKSPIIEVRSKLANAKFTGPKTLKVYDPRLELPLSITNAQGKSQQLKYSINGTEVVTTIKDKTLAITQPGVYKLLEFNDGCLGTVGNEEIVVSVYERPTIELIHQEEEICAGATSSDTLHLKGEAPFKVWSETVDPNSKTHYDHHDTANSRIKLTNMPRSTPGTWTTYYWLADKLYPKGDKSSGVLILKQKVREEPVVMHARPGSTYSLCQSANNRQGIPLVLNGIGPFVVYLELKDTRGKVITKKVDISKEDAAARTYNLYEPFIELSGSYQVRLLSVKDSFGCVGHPIHSKATVHVNTVKAPKLDVEKHDYCIGDYVNLGTSHGTGVLKLDYTLNNRKHTVSGEKSFKLLASAPGSMHLLTLRDEAKCPANIDQEITIHDLPSSRITRQPTFNIHSDEEVELQFAFTGTAPFTFVYTRTVDGREVERHTVKNVQDHQHSIFANENGVYEIVSLQDAFCSVHL